MLPDVQIRIRRLALLAILALGFALRFHALDQNGWGAEYYTAAVRSMAGDAHRFLFAAFDPAGFLAVDKPPLALWIQTVSVTLFGFRPFSLLMPQVLAGVLSVAVLYRMTRPRLGAACALTAALLFAVTPVWVAVNRSNVMDTWLVLLLPFQRLFYRPLLYVTVYRAVWRALTGRLAGWGKLARRVTARRP